MTEVTSALKMTKVTLRTTKVLVSTIVAVRMMSMVNNKINVFTGIWASPNSSESLEGRYLKGDLKKCNLNAFSFFYLKKNFKKIGREVRCFGGLGRDDRHFVCGLTCNHEAGQRCS